MLKNYTLLDKLNQLLQPNNFSDYCPNGLQVEGVSAIRKIITGVSISQQLIDVAIKEAAQGIIVHHGLIWSKEEQSIIGVKQQRLAKLLKHGINLFAYHLPLDNHPFVGNNAQLAKLLGITVTGSTSVQNLLWYGKLNKAMPFKQFISMINQRLGHTVHYFCADGQETKLIKTVAWCTGGGDNFFSDAIKLAVDVYITGDNSEPAMALSHESGVHYIAAGHYATERYGIMALSDYLNSQLQLEAKYVELYNPA